MSVDNGKVEVNDVAQFFKLKKEASKLKKQIDILGKHIKENVLPNDKQSYGDYIVKISLSERTILDTKAIKEAYPKIYNTFGKIQEVKTLSVKEA